MVLLLLASTAHTGKKTMKFLIKPNQSFFKRLKEGPLWLDDKLHSQEVQPAMIDSIIILTGLVGTTVILSS
jgi:hypothetical protein